MINFTSFLNSFFTAARIVALVGVGMVASSQTGVAADYTIGAACTGTISAGPQAANGNNIVCNSSLWQYPAYQFGVGPTACNSTNAGIVQWTGSALQVCTGSAWTALTAGGATGAGTVNYVARWTGATMLGTGTLYDNGTQVGIGTTAPTGTLQVNGTTPTLNVTGTTSSSLTMSGTGVALTLQGNGSAGLNFQNASASNNPPVLNFAKFGASGLPNPNDQLGAIEFNASNSSYAYVPVAYIVGTTIGTDTNASMPSALYFMTTPVGSNQPAERMRVDSTGYVGIGTSAPASALQLASGQIEMPDGTVSAPSYSFTNNPNMGMYRTGANNLAFATAGAEFMTTDSADVYFDHTVSMRLFSTTAYVAAGTSSASPAAASASPLILNSSAATNGVGAFLNLRAANSIGTSQVSYIGNISNASGYTPTVVIGQQTGATSYAERVRIDASGNVGIGSTAPVNSLDINGVIDAGEVLGYDSVIHLKNTYGGVTTLRSNTISINTPVLNALDVNGGIAIGSSYGGFVAAPSMGAIIQGIVGIGSSLPVASLDLSQKTDAIALPTGNTTNRPTGASLVNGEIRYNTSIPGVEAYVNGAWTSLGGGASITGTGTANYVAKWTGATTLGTGTLFDNGTQVGIGTTNPLTVLDVPSYSTSGSIVRAGSLEFSSYSLNNSFFGDNIYYNGSSFTRRQTGTGGLLYFFGSGSGNGSMEGQMRLYATGIGTAGINSGIAQMKVNQDGSFAVGSSMVTTPGTYTGASFYVSSAGSVGIGSTSPAAVLDVNGGIDLKGLNGISYPNAGADAGSLAIGPGAAAGQTASGLNSLAIGSGALANVTNQSLNIGIGLNAGPSNSSQSNTISIGEFIYGGRAASNDILIGCCAAGSSSGNNIIIGLANAGVHLSSGNTVAIGAGVLGSSGYPGTSSVVALGYSALSAATGSLVNDVAVGASSLQNLVGSSNNVGLGPAAGYAITTGNGNVAIGPGVGATTLTTGSYNILIGTNSGVDVGTSTASNTLNIGNLVYGTGLGSSGTTPAGKLGIGTNNPQFTLDVNSGGGYQTALLEGNTDVFINLQSNSYNSRSAVALSGAGGFDGFIIYQYSGDDTLRFVNGNNINSSPTVLAINGASNVGIGSVGPVVSLDLSQRADALALPVGSSGARPTGTALVNGEIRYNTSTPGVEAYVNGSWTALGGGAGTITGAGTTNYVARWTGASALGTGTLVDTGTAVGIGTTTPANNLQIGNLATSPTSTPVTFSLGGTYAGSAAGQYPKLKIYDNGTNVYGIGVSSNSFDYMAPGSAGQSFYVNGSTTASVKILPAGNVAIGGATAGNKLDVYGNMALGSYAGTAGPSNGLIVSGNVGLGTTVPTNSLSLGGSAARTIWMERSTTAGFDLTVQAGGGASAGTNKNGGNLILASGIATGTGSSSIQFNTYPAGTTGTADDTAATAMTILGSGYVGIGLTNPVNPLTVANTGATAVAQFENTGTGANALYIYPFTDGNTYLQHTGNVVFSPVASTTPQLVITTSGSVGIGTASPASPVHVYATTSNALLTLQNSAGNYPGVVLQNSVGYYSTQLDGSTASYYWYNNGSRTMNLTQAGSLGIGSITPVASLDLSQKTDAIALPTGSTANRPTGTALVNGEIRYNTSTPGVEAYVNGTWTSLGGSAGTVSGTGTANYVAKWTGATALGTGTLYDDGTNVAVGTTSPSSLLSVVSNVSSTAPSSWLDLSNPSYTNTNSNGDANGNPHGIFAITTNTYTGAGGAQLNGYSNGSRGGAYALTLGGFTGVNNPGANYPAIFMGGQKLNSGNGTLSSPLDTTDIIVSIGNSLPGGGSPGNQQFNFLANGNMGIGTTSPGDSLHIVSNRGAEYGSGTGTLRVQNTNASAGAAVIEIYSNGEGDLDVGLTNSADGTPGVAYFDNRNNADMKFLTNDAERLRITNTGQVGVGTSSPGYMLAVNGTAYATGAAGALSDIRHKTDIEPLTAGLKEVSELKPVTFKWKNPLDAGMQGKQTGFIAQDVEKVLPSTVLTQDNAEKTKNLKYNELIPVLTKALQELKAQEDADHANMAKLQADFDAYRKAHP